MKKHIALIVLADDDNKTPLANTNTEVMFWWEALNKSSRIKVIQDHYGTLPQKLTWPLIREVYDKVHESLCV